MPSHLISKSQFGSENTLPAILASVTETSRGIGAMCAPGHSAGFGGAETWLALFFSFCVFGISRPLTTDSPCSSTSHIETACATRRLLSNQPFLLRLSL